MDGKWEMYGMYNENFIQQLAAAVEALALSGGRVYDTIRVVEVTDGKPDLL